MAFVAKMHDKWLAVFISRRAVDGASFLTWKLNKWALIAVSVAEIHGEWLNV